MAVIKRQWRTLLAVVAILAGVFLLWDRKTYGDTTPGFAHTISVPTLFEDLDGGAHDADLANNGSVTFAGDLTIANGGSITCDETGTNADACPITLIVEGDLLIEAGGSIHADNLGSEGGNGGDITITVDGDFTMEGPSGGNPGALISSRQLGGGNGEGGDILIIVGGVTVIDDPTSADPDAPGIGVCNTPDGDALIEAGATITSDAASGRAGDIALYTGRNITVHGTVRAQGFEGAGHGGAITLDACCDLLIGDTGVVSSVGRDPGPDRVHLEACIVTIYGLVQSTGPAHENPAPLCNSPDRPGKPLDGIYTACVEIWSGTTILIDSTGTHTGEINADVGFSGGPSGRGWIDILANFDIVLNDGTGNDLDPNPLTPGPDTPYLVHANMYDLTNGFGGDILVQSKLGGVSTFGNALQANSLPAGGDGGSVRVEAGGALCPAGDVALDQASIEARGAIHENGKGGLIAIRSFNCDITGTQPGKLDATGDLAAFPGLITLTACANPISYSGFETPTAVRNPGQCGGMPTFPVPADTQLPAANCFQVCSPPTPTPTPTNTPTPTSTTPTPTPTTTPPFCNKDAVRTVLAGRNPDILVRTDLNQPIQNAVDNVTDTTGDGYLIVGVVNNAAGVYGGHVYNQVVRINNQYTLPFLLIGCSVTLHDPTPTDGNPVIQITSNAFSPGPKNIFSMDVHTTDSGYVGFESTGNNRYIRNTNSLNNAINFKVTGDGNTMHNGAALYAGKRSNGTFYPAGPNVGVGFWLIGNSNLMTDTTIQYNRSHGILAAGDSNRFLKMQIGDVSGRGNLGDGLNLAGSFNLIQENTARTNTLNGINIVSGSSNTLKKNVSGGTAGQNNLDCEYLVTAGNINGGENKSNGATVGGSPFPAGCTGSP